MSLVSGAVTTHASRLTTTLAWAGAIVSVLFTVVLLWFAFDRAPLPDHPVPELADATYAVGIAIFAIVGAIIATSQPRNRIGWILVGVGLTLSANDLAHEYVLRSLVNPDLPATGPVGWLSVWIWAAGFALMGALMLVFPTGALPSKRWRPVLWTLAACAVSFMLIAVPLLGRDPMYLIDDTALERDIPWGSAITSIEFAAVVAALISLVVRYRGSTGHERRQLKLIGYTAGVMATYLVVEVFLFDRLGLADTVLADAFGVFGNLGVIAFPASIGVAILRHGLFEIDFIINRTLVYGALTAALAAMYLGIVFVLQNLVPLGGDSDIAVAASTLVVAGLFRPLRSGIQALIDRRFFRSRYDAAGTLADFSARLRDQVDVDNVREEALDVVATTIQPSHASIWLMDAT